MADNLVHLASLSHLLFSENTLVLTWVPPGQAPGRLSKSKCVHTHIPPSERPYPLNLSAKLGPQDFCLFVSELENRKQNA